jgi:hypothetical protein
LAVGAAEVVEVVEVVDEVVVSLGWRVEGGGLFPS